MKYRLILTKRFEKDVKRCVKRGVKGSPAPIPQEGAWTKCKEIKDISGLTHGCACWQRWLLRLSLLSYLLPRLF